MLSPKLICLFNLFFSCNLFLPSFCLLSFYQVISRNRFIFFCTCGLQYCIRGCGFYFLLCFGIKATLHIYHVYHFFASKDDIITAIISRDLQQLFSLMAEIAARPESLHAALVNSVQRGVDDNLEPTYSALQLEMLAEAARNPHVASILREADASARQHLRELLLGDPAQAIAPEQLDSTLEVISTLFNGLLIRAVLHPELDRAALTEQVQHVMRSLLARLSLPPR